MSDVRNLPQDATGVAIETVQNLLSQAAHSEGRVIQYMNDPFGPMNDRIEPHRARAAALRKVANLLTIIVNTVDYDCWNQSEND